MTIFKYELQTIDHQKIIMGADAHILCVKVQKEVPVIWALTDEDAPLIKREFILFGTGHDINKKMLEHIGYIGTFQLAKGSLVFHLFEVFD